MMKNFAKSRIKNALVIALGMAMVSVPYITQAAPVPVKDADAKEALDKIESSAKEEWEKLQKKLSVDRGKAQGKFPKAVELNAEEVGKDTYDSKIESTENTREVEKFLGKTTHCVEPEKEFGKDNKLAEANYKACVYERALKVITLNEMTKAFKVINERNKEIDKLVQSFKDEEMTTGKLQAYQFQMAYYQTQIQQDMARLKLSLDIHNQRAEIYRQKQLDTASAMMRGNNKAVDLGGILTTLGVGALLK